MRRELCPRSYARLRRGLLSAAVVALALCFPFNCWAKDAPVSAVLLFGGPAEPAYIQITGLLINGKTELRVCNGPGSIEKSAYKNLPKVNLSSVHSLKRLSDGSMSAVTDEAALACVVPGNYKFDKVSSMSASELAGKSSITGQVLGSSAAGITSLPPFAPGSELVIGGPTDNNTAEYLRASHAASPALLQMYVNSSPSGPYIVAARKQLTNLLTTDGSLQLDLYRKSAGSSSPNFGALKASRSDADSALAALPGSEGAAALSIGVDAELTKIIAGASTDLADFKQALAQGKPGYSKLIHATELSQAVTSIDSKNQAGTTLAMDIGNQNHALEAAIRGAQSQIAAQQYEMALASLKKYQSFTAEDQDVGRLFKQIYTHYLEKGTEAIAQGNWTVAVEELKRAQAVEETPEATSKLTAAETGLRDAENRTASAQALAKSQQYVEEKDPIHAYEVLADLMPAQRALVQEQLTALEEAYIKASTAKAQQLQQTHTPMRGRADEDAMRQAHEYYRRASELSNDEEIAIKRDLLAEEISNYYVGLGKVYMGKPLASEVGVGWAYMAEALQYRNNMDEVRDAMTNNRAAYQMRARLSLGVLFRDQTSRRDSAGFTDQMQQAFATGLESSELPVKVFLPGDTSGMKPNFQFIGDVLQHRTIRTPKRETLQSKYRSGSREVPNEAWNKADQAYEEEMLELQREQSALTSAQSRNNKKQIENASNSLTEAEGKVTQLRAKMNALPRTISEPIVNPYNYTRTTLELTDIVELSFRILDSQDNPIGAPIHVIEGEKPRKFVILDNMKPDDTEGLKEADSPPDETQLMNDVEIEARDRIVQEARKAVQDLPNKVLANARVLASSSDVDGAAEMYVLYLNSTPSDESPERLEASRFLSEKFNIRHGLTLSASLK